MTLSTYSQVNNPYEPYIAVRWPHGGVLVWNWHLASWEHRASSSTPADGGKP